MKLLIMSLEEALGYMPDEPTYALRIFSPRYLSEAFSLTLQASSNYTHIEIAAFDDVEPLFDAHNNVFFDDRMATGMLAEFVKHKGGCSAFLVHCARGRNRSPAVGAAFNEIFDFGHDADELKRRYRFGRLGGANMHVYNTLMRVAREKEYF